MALTRIESAFTYRSEKEGQSYIFTIVVDANNCTFVRDIQGPYGYLNESCTSLPEFVADDIQTAKTQAKVMNDMVSVSSGILDFNNETTKTVSFDTALANTEYRVVFSKEDFILARVTNKLTTGFTVELNVTYTGTLGFDVLV